MRSNLQRYGDILANRTKRTADAAVPLYLELGKIENNLYLKVDSVKDPIASDQYLISLSLTHENYFSYNEMNSSAAAPHHHEGGEHTQYRGSGYHTHDDGLHDHRIPSVFRKLQVGDRVLVAWCGAQPVIVDIVVAGDTISTN